MSTDVRRVKTTHGSHIEPPLNDDWTDLEKLQWHLAVTLHDSGKPADLFTIRQDDSRLGRKAYALEWNYGGMSPMTYGSMWTLIDGISMGFEFATKDEP